MQRVVSLLLVKQAGLILLLLLAFLLSCSGKAAVSSVKFHPNQVYNGVFQAATYSAGYYVVEVQLYNKHVIQLATTTINNILLFKAPEKGDLVRWRVASVASNYHDHSTNVAYTNLNFVEFMPELPARGRIVNWTKQHDMLLINVISVDQQKHLHDKPVTLRYELTRPLDFELISGLPIAWHGNNDFISPPTRVGQPLYLTIDHLIATAN